MKKRILLFFLAFIYILLFNLFFVPITSDEVWNYGFAYNISLGLVPYRDFNMIITPFFPAFMAIFLKIFGHNILVFYIANSLCLTFCFFLILKMLGKKGWLFFVFLFAPLTLIMPSYNLFAFILIIIIFYLEKEKKSDYLIGFLLGFLILTKQNIGIMVLIPGLFYYYKDKIRIVKRFLTCFFVLLLFVVYLLITNSFMSFLDLCVFGLFDFSNNNGNLSICTIFFVIILICTVYFVKKYPNNIYNYYALSFYTIMFPIFDYYHFGIALLMFLFLSLYYLPDNIKLPYMFITIFIIILLPILVYFREFYNKKVIYPNDFNNFQYRYINYRVYSVYDKLNEFINKHSEYDFIFLGEESYFLKLVNDRIPGYLDLVNNGNWGYDGNRKMLDALKKKKNDTLIFVEPNTVNLKTQTNLELINYVLENGKKIDNVLCYDVYILE